MNKPIGPKQFSYKIPQLQSKSETETEIIEQIQTETIKIQSQTQQKTSFQNKEKQFSSSSSTENEDDNNTNETIQKIINHSKTNTFTHSSYKSLSLNKKSGCFLFFKKGFFLKDDKNNISTNFTKRSRSFQSLKSGILNDSLKKYRKKRGNEDLNRKCLVF